MRRNLDRTLLGKSASALISHIIDCDRLSTASYAVRCLINHNSRTSESRSSPAMIADWPLFESLEDSLSMNFSPSLDYGKSPYF